MEMFAAFFCRAIIQGTPLLFGATGEIITEKSGNLNLGIPGIMYFGAISGVIGAFFYENSGAFIPAVGVIIALISCLIGSLFASLIYCFLTITLRANQNVTGLALTTFGVGFGEFFGGSLIKVTKSSVPYLALSD
ncbi:MAG: ABC transporter permease, partial [Clostridia bacterium]|nr:ABC transporter permease [Clostridia bacterium]